MLDEEHGHVRRDALDDVADALALGGGKPGERLVEEQQPRLRRQRQPHVEEALAAIGERAGLGPLHAGDAEIADECRGLALDVGERARLRPGIEAVPMACLDREPHVLLDRERREQVGDLEGAADPGRGDRLRAQPGDRAAAEEDLALVRHEHPGDQVEGGGLAGAVRADQRVQAAVAHQDVDALHGLDAAEALGDAARLKDRLRRHDRRA